MKTLLLVLGTFISLQLSAQDLIQDLNFYGDIIANAHAPEHRARAQKEFISLFDQFSQQQDAESKLPEIKYIVVKQPADKSFSLVTWQLLTENNSSYYGYLFKDGKAIKLSQNTNILDDSKYSELSADDWYGAMYFNITQEVYEGVNYYLLYGYNAYKDENHVKLVDVLTFDGNTPVFGAEVFKKEMQGTRDDVAYRIVLPYTADANVRLNYDNQLGMIVYDHIVKQNTPRGELFIPDGSYVGYKWNNESGKYEYVEKVFNQVSTIPPSTGKKKKKRRNKSLYKRKKRN